jgi:hypothetical protein
MTDIIIRIESALPIVKVILLQAILCPMMEKNNTPFKSNLFGAIVFSITINKLLMLKPQGGIGASNKPPLT